METGITQEMTSIGAAASKDGANGKAKDGANDKAKDGASDSKAHTHAWTAVADAKDTKDTKGIEAKDVKSLGGDAKHAKGLLKSNDPPEAHEHLPEVHLGVSPGSIGWSIPYLSSRA